MKNFKTSSKSFSIFNYIYCNNLKTMKKIYLSISFFFALNANAQLTINTGLDTNSMSNILEGLGVDIHNMSINCDPNAYGQFSGFSEMQINDGIVLATGDASVMIGPNTSTSSGTDNGYPGDADLTFMANCQTYNACVLEFDAIPVGDTLYFNFAFGSEEYMEWVAGGFNDVFAILVSGIGFPSPTNIAILPNSTIVSVLNVNANTNSAYYIDNETVPGTFVSYDGFTTNIEVEVVVVPQTNYHFKIGIADALDGAVDSGVMLEAFSFRSPISTLGILENEDSFTMFPNPAVNELTLNFKSISADVILMNNLGQALLSKTNVTNGTILNLSDLPNGSYFIKLKTNTEESIQPLLIVR